MLTRTILLAAVLALTAATAASARTHHHYRHHHGFISHGFTSSNVSFYRGGARARITRRGGDRSPAGIGGY
jgi:hypothetical protein